MRFTSLAVGFVVAWFAQIAPAQQFAPTTVQLPTFSAFTASTVVAVPDSGYGFAHRPCQVSHGHTAYGPAWGASTTHWEVVDHVSVWSVGAQTIDLAAMDADLLASAPPAPVAPPPPIVQKLAAKPQSTAARVPGSVADARRARAAALAEEETELDTLLAKAETLLAQGKPNVARIYLQMAAGKTSGERKRELEARAAALKGMPNR
jgi:hypothetical protein